jgi:hydroxymethylbilane synthase
VVKDVVTGTVADAEELGKELAQRMKKQGAQEILQQIFAEVRPVA